MLNGSSGVSLGARLLFAAPLVFGAILAAGMGTASADTATLICKLQLPPANDVVEEQPTTIDLNEAQHSVTIHYGPEHTDLGGPHQFPATTVGPLPATFDTNMIAFSDDHGSYSINRLTGVFVGAGRWQWGCEQGKAKF